MSFVPPSIPPDVTTAEGPDWLAWWQTFFLALYENAPQALELAKEPAGKFIAEVAAVLVELSIEITSEVGKRMGEAVDEFEATAGPLILKAAATGLSDYFGATISAGQIDRGRGADQRFAFGEQLGRLVLENMFGGFASPQALTPDDGRRNAERVLGFNIATTLESWLGKVTTTTPLTKWIPNWADLDDVMSASLGLGRANRRVLGPLLKTLVVEPFEWDLNRRFASRQFSVAELVSLERRRALDPGVYFEQMSWYGYSKEKAGKILSVLTKLPEKEDVARMIELGTISEERARAIFAALGYSEDGAAAMLELAKENRVQSLNNAIESVGRDMYRDREIDDAEFRSILQAAGRAPKEIDTLLGLGQLERSRPRPLPRGDIEDGFRRGLIPLSRLRVYYAQFGFALEDQVLLEEMAVEDRIAAEAREEAAKLKAQGLDFRLVPSGQIERAYVEGRIGAARLREYYTDRQYSEADVALLLENAALRKTEFDRARAEELERAKTPAFVSLPKGTMEEAFFRDVVDAGRLREYYSATGLSPGDADVALRVAREKKTERAERLEEELKRANRPDFLELPRAVMEEAFFRGLVSEARLRDWYEGRGFRETEIPILLELARLKKAERAAAAAAAAAKPQTPPPAP